MRDWESEFDVIGFSLSLWNVNVIPWMEQRGDEYKKYAHARAKRLGYQYNKERHAYEQANPLTAEEYVATMRKLASREIRKWLCRDTKRIGQHGKPRQGKNRLLPTRVKGVMAYWTCTSADETGLLILWDGRKEEGVIETLWDGVPEHMYRRLFEPDGRKGLNDLLTIYRGKEMDPKDSIELMHKMERDWDDA